MGARHSHKPRYFTPPVDVGHGARYRITPTRINRRQEDLSSTLILTILILVLSALSVSEKRLGGTISHLGINAWEIGQAKMIQEYLTAFSTRSRRFLMINFRSWIFLFMWTMPQRVIRIIASIFTPLFFFLRKRRNVNENKFGVKFCHYQFFKRNRTV